MIGLWLAIFLSPLSSQFGPASAGNWQREAEADYFWAFWGNNDSGSFYSLGYACGALQAICSIYAIDPNAVAPLEPEYPVIFPWSLSWENWVNYQSESRMWLEVGWVFSRDPLRIAFEAGYYQGISDALRYSD